MICSACGSRGHYNRNCPTPSALRNNSYGSRCGTCGSTLHLASNCPSIWRIYDTRGAKGGGGNNKVTYACANDGTTGDHFIDDWLVSFSILSISFV